MNIVNDDFSVQYKEILKTEFENLVPTQNITITDTVIFNKGNREEYLVIQGRAFDSIRAQQAKSVSKTIERLKMFFREELKLYL